MFLRTGGYWEELEAVGFEELGVGDGSGFSSLASGVDLVLRCGRWYLL